jgi:hypothetical protein
MVIMMITIRITIGMTKIRTTMEQAFIRVIIGGIQDLGVGMLDGHIMVDGI